MSSNDKWEYILRLDEELLVRSAIISEWSTFLVRNADIAFCAGANLASILTAQAAMESHLRYERCASPKQRKLGFYDLIEQAELPCDLRAALHDFRRFRNKWVHVADPQDDQALLDRPEIAEAELQKFAFLAIRLMRQIIYLDQFV
jgi:hypothetical protein